MAGFLRGFPFCSLPLIAYFLMQMSGIDVTAEASPITTLSLLSGATVHILPYHVLLLGAFLVLYIGIMLATWYSKMVLINHVASTITFILYVVLFLYLPRAGTGSFLLLTVLAFIDVVAGFSVTIRSAARDVALRS